MTGEVPQATRPGDASGAVGGGREGALDARRGNRQGCPGCLDSSYYHNKYRQIGKAGIAFIVYVIGILCNMSDDT